MNSKLLLHTFKITLPVKFGYVPLGIAFGIMFSDLGYGWIYSFLMGILVFAGSSQFLALGMLAMGESIWEIGLMTFVLNSRQAFYGISLLKSFETIWWKKLYLIFTLSDEPYSLITSTKVPEQYDKINFYLAMNAWTHIYWVGGCTLGALLSGNLPFDSRGMDFTLTALFIVLAVEQFKKVRQLFPFFVALSVGALCLALLPKTHMLVSSIGISITFIILRGRMSQWT